MMELLIGLACVTALVLGVAAWNHIRYQHKRQRFEPFIQSEQRFRDRIPEGYLTVAFWAALLIAIFLIQTAWTAARGPNPTSAMPYITMLAAGIAVFGLAVTSLNFIISMKALHQTRINSSAQLICYMAKAGDNLVIRFENASSSSAAFDVKAFVANEDPANYLDKKKRFLGNEVVLLEAPSFPPGSLFDVIIPGMANGDIQRGVSIEVGVEWNSFHDQPFGSSFKLNTPLAFTKAR